MYACLHNKRITRVRRLEVSEAPPTLSNLFQSALKCAPRLAEVPTTAQQTQHNAPIHSYGVGPNKIGVPGCIREIKHTRPEGQPPTVKGGAKSGKACEHWDRLGEDLGLIQGLGVGSYR